jgi:uncharacterized repeat protein (TIGR03847 family)
MSQSYSLPDPDVFWAGADGPPGQRVFYLVAGEADDLVFLKCEKQHVAALAEYLEGLLEELAPSGPPVEHGTVAAGPFSWVIGSLGVKFEEPEDRIVVVAEELVDEEAGEKAAVAHLRLTREQAAGFVAHAQELVAAGRPLCALCALPLDPEGHACPRMN